MRKVQQGTGLSQRNGIGKEGQVLVFYDYMMQESLPPPSENAYTCHPRRMKKERLATRPAALTTGS